MSTNDRIQLKREQVVGNEVALEDINPKTNTKSIDDSNSGVSLDETIDRLWNSINNKLSRIVNSVNGRTGVVILSSEDVGLGNVDNVSYADIKKWVIDRLEQEFNTKRIKLFESLDEVETFINEHQDKAYADIAYYSHHGYTDPTNVAYDLRGYIGYIYFDEDHQVMSHAYKVIDSIGYTDNSVLYNEKIEYDEPGVADKDLHGGGLGVNIWKYEDALEIYNDVSGYKADSGLRIKKDKIIANVYYFDGVYGNGNASDEDAFLYFDTSTMPVDAKPVKIKIDGTELTPDVRYTINNNFGGINYLRQDVRLNDLIICNFNDENYIRRNPNEGMDDLISDLMNPLLMNQNPAIGKVVKAPTPDNPNEEYEIDFYPIKPNIYRGLKKYDTHTEQTSPGLQGSAVGVGLIEVSHLASYYGEPMYNGTSNVSGLNAFASYTAYNPRTSSGNTDRSYQTILPCGKSFNVFGDSGVNGNDDSSVYILPNYSLCVIPREAYTGTNNMRMPNWPIHAPETIDPCEGDAGSHQSLLGINLTKFIDIDSEVGESYAVNISGLKVTGDQPLTANWFGDGTGSTIIQPDHHSGGLSINVGKFLEIGSYDTLDQTRTDKNRYYEDGKVNVRVDDTAGLDDTDSNKLGIKIESQNITIGGGGYTGGLTFSSGGNASVPGGLTINPGLGIYFDKNYGDGPSSSGAVSDPSPMPPHSSSPSHTVLTLGIADTLNTAMYTGSDDRSNSARKYLYGGLRFATNPSENIAGNHSVLSIRVNDSDNWGAFSEDFNIDVSMQRGTKGICIDEENVLGIMPFNIGDDGNVLKVKSMREMVEEFIDTRVFLGRSTMSYASTAAFPAIGQADRLYVSYENGYPEHYIWNVQAGEYEKFVEILLNIDPWRRYPDPGTATHNKVYANLTYNTAMISSYGAMKTIFHPDVNGDDQVTTYEKNLATELSALTVDKQKEILSHEMFVRLDVDGDGVITAADATLIENYLDYLSTQGLTDTYDQFVIYMHDHNYNNPTDDTHWYYLNAVTGEWVLYNETLHPNTFFNISEGVDVGCNIYGGLRNKTTGTLTSSSGGSVRNVPFTRDTLEVNISDVSSRHNAWEYDPYRAGGLRFGAGGVLAIRINDNDTYNNINGSGLDNLVTGTKGLCIDSDNVLGVNIDEGHLVIDSETGALQTLNRFIVPYREDPPKAFERYTLVIDTTTNDLYLVLRNFESTTLAGDVANGNIVKIAQTITP